MGQIYQQLTSISLCKQYFLSKEEGHLLLSWPALAPSRHFITCQAWYCAGTSQTLSPSARNRIPFVTSKCDLANWRFPKIWVYPQIILTWFSSINHPFGGTVHGTPQCYDVTWFIPGTRWFPTSATYTVPLSKAQMPPGTVESSLGYLISWLSRQMI